MLGKGSRMEGVLEQKSQVYFGKRYRAEPVIKLLDAWRGFMSVGYRFFGGM